MPVCRVNDPRYTLDVIGADLDQASDAALFVEVLRCFVAETPGKCSPQGILPQARLGDPANPGAPVGTFKGGFQRALKEAGVLFASDGKKRVPYSLRHTYATMRLAEGVSVFQLAANMGTSVEMLEDFYGKKRMRDPKMATEVTKNRSRMDT